MKATDPEKRIGRVTCGPSGLTLVEVVIAIGILLISTGALLWAFVSAKHSSTVAQNRVLAMENARNELELLRIQPYSSVSNFGPVAITNAIFTGISGKRQWTVTDFTNSSGDSIYKEVIVTISWLNPGSAESSSLSNSTVFFNTN
ncbi:MAG: type II secretion system protein [Lentisphaerae bacterium]|nr:type II secretion system protein [Lentisphaerota bacterium]